MAVRLLAKVECFLLVAAEWTLSQFEFNFSNYACCCYADAVSWNVSTWQFQFSRWWKTHNWLCLLVLNWYVNSLYRILLLLMILTHQHLLQPTPLQELEVLSELSLTVCMPLLTVTSKFILGRLTRFHLDDVIYTIHHIHITCHYYYYYCYYYYYLFVALWILSGTSRVSRYQKKHCIDHHQTVIINLQTYSIL